MAASKDDATIDDLKAQIEKLREDMAGLTSIVGGIGKGAAKDGEERIRGIAEDAGERIGEVEAKAGEMIRERPVQSLLIAAGLGLVVGLLTRR